MILPDLRTAALYALGVALAGSLALNLAQRVQVAHAQKALSDYKLAAVTNQRSEETRRQTAVDKELINAQPAIAAEARDAAAVPDSRVREPAIRYIRRACPNPPAAAPSAPAADPVLVFADVLGRIEQRSEDLARIAGERGTAGTLCERAYDAFVQPR